MQYFSNWFIIHFLRFLLSSNLGTKKVSWSKKLFLLVYIYMEDSFPGVKGSSPLKKTHKKVVAK